MTRSFNIFLGAGVRTPIGKFGGALAQFSAADLGTLAARETISRGGVSPSDIDEVIFGCARQAGAGPNPARQISHRAGCPESVPAYTINKACASGIRSIANAYQSIAVGDSDVVLAGGTEAMSRIPYLLTGGRWGYRLGHSDLVDAMYQDGYDCPLCEEVMGSTAENLAEKYQVSREESEVYALRSQERHKAARDDGKFSREIVPVQLQGRKGDKTLFEHDEHPRPNTTLEKLAKLPPVFRSNGTVHAGNASGITDGAASVLVFSEEARARLGVKPVARIVDYTSVGVDPALMGISPVPAVQKLFERNKLSLADIDLIELNEAFAVQVLACERELKFDLEKVNVNGGAIAMGHPTGCTGTRITVTLLHEMERRDANLGIATLCVSGGLGMALLLERV